MKRLVIGILSLQGGFEKHGAAVKALNAEPCFVRYPDELKACDALIIPGGESTTISKQIDYIALREPIMEFSKSKPIFGTCAGLIMMAKESGSPDVNALQLMDIEVLRNGYGAQGESFSAEIFTSLEQSKRPFHAIFIRGPRISHVGADVKILGYFQKEPVLIQQGLFLAATFHPELTSDLRIHRHFLSLIPLK